MVFLSAWSKKLPITGMKRLNNLLNLIINEYRGKTIINFIIIYRK